MSIYKSKAIVLHQIKYSETSIIAYLYTEQFGRIQALIKGARKKEARIKSNLFQPLFLLDLELYYNHKKNFQTIKEAHLNPLLLSIAENTTKKTISLFLAEVLYKVLKEENSDKNLFSFIYNSVQIFDHLQENISNFHLCFLVHLTSYLGFYPAGSFSETNKYFDLLNGVFCKNAPIHNHFIDNESAYFFNKLLNSDIHFPYLENISGTKRFELLEKIINYYKIHFEGLGVIQSLEVLNDLYHD
jgi:DNA repair protein RecO (recombination protein O)